MDLQPIGPVAGVLFAAEPLGGIAWKTSRDHDMASGSQQLQRDMKADLDTAASQHGVAPREIDGPLASLPVEFGTIRTQRVVEEVDPLVVPLADVATASDVELIDEVLGIPFALGR